MEHNLSVYGVALRYALCVIFGMIGGLLYSSMTVLGIVLALLSVMFFLEAILAWSPLVYFMGKDNSKKAVDDFQ